MHKFDVIIPVAYKEVDFIPRVIEYIERCFVDVRGIYILTSAENGARIKKILRASTEKSSIKILDENETVPNLNYNRIKGLLAKHGKEDSTGWFLQQFLKLGFPLSENGKDYYLSWDADTLPLAKISFFEGDNIFFTPKREYNPNYFNTTEKLLGIGKIEENSFISEHMMFSSVIVKEMIRDIENSKIIGDDWIEKIINACDFSDFRPSFSEFETYGNYCALKYPGLYVSRHLNTFREAGLIAGRHISDEILRRLSFDLDVASFEMRDQPPFPYNMPFIIWNWKRRFNIIKKMKFKDVLKKIKNKMYKDKQTEVNIEKMKEMNCRLPQSSKNC